MKKSASILCLIFMLWSMLLPVSAQETAKTEDSVTISDEILSCLDMETVDTIFRVYVFSHFYSDFVKYGDLDGVLANTSASQFGTCYFVKTKGGETNSYTYDGIGLIESNRYSGRAALWFDIHSEQAEEIIKKVSSDIVVENVFYLWFSGMDDSWFAVYYKTNLGDYVYIPSEQKAYLMGLDQFIAMQNVIYDRYAYMAIRKGPWTLGRDIVVTPESAPVDLSPYDITSPDFNPHAPLKTNFKPGKFIAIGSFVLLLTLIVCRYLIRGHRKYREKKERMIYRF